MSHRRNLKGPSRQTRRESGGTLMVTMATAALLGLALTTYLKLVNSQNQLVMRSQVWNSCMPILEAGIEEALTHCQENYVTNMASNGWALFGSTYVKSNVLGDGFFITAISQSTPYEIVSRGFSPMPGSQTMLRRTVRVTTAPQSVFFGAMVMRNTIRMNGNDVYTDSYDSEDETKSTSGKYDPTKAGDAGHVGALAGIADAFNLGNANIKGKAFTGPSGTLRVGPNGAVGSTGWHAAGNYGVQSGWWLPDMNIDFPDVEWPSAAGLPPLTGSLGGTNVVLLTDGVWELGTLSSSVLVNGDATLYVTGNINMKSLDFIDIAPGSSLTIYMSGASATIGSVINNSGNATGFTYFGLPTHTSLTLNGNSAMSAAVYAPEASITMNGSIDFYGSLVGKDATLNGQGAFHFDQALERIDPRRAIIVTSWNEV